MHARQRPSDALLRLMDEQAGCATTEQALSLGLSTKAIARLTAEGWWASQARGVHRRGEPSWVGSVWAGVLVAGDGAVVGGRAALALHGVADEPDEIDVWQTTHVADRPPWRFRRGVRSGRGSPPRVAVETALLDVAPRVSEGDLMVLVGKALRSGRTTPERLWDAARTRPRLARRDLLGDLLVGGDRGADSPLERHYVRLVERPHGLPEAERQVWLPGGRSDGVYRDYGVALELDGERYHGPSRAQADRERDTLNATQGWLTIRTGWAEVVGDSCGLARRVGAVLQSRGWSAPVVPCRQCAR